MIRRSGVVALFASVLLFCAVSRAATVPTLPSGTPINVRLTDGLTSENAKPGQEFRGTLATPVVVAGRVVFEKGTEVRGRVVSVHASGRLSDSGMLELSLFSIGRNAVPITTASVVIKGESHAKNNVGKIGAGAAIGGILGGIFGGGKGAAVGAGVGAGAGTAAAASSGKKPAIVEREAVLAWTTSQPVDLSPAGPTEPRREAREDYRRDAVYARHDDDDDHDHARREDRDRDDDHDGDRERESFREDDRSQLRGDARYYFNDSDREIIEGCVADMQSSLPPGLAKKDRLPPGLERQLHRNGTLPPGLRKRFTPMPHECNLRLPRIPHSWARIIVSGRVILVDANLRIVDLFTLGDRD
jgi:hypothetical protein